MRTAGSVQVQQWGNRATAGRGERARRERRRRAVRLGRGRLGCGRGKRKGLGLYRPWAGPAVAAFVG